MALLKKIPLFANLDDDARERVASLLQEKTMKRHDSVYRTGTPALQAYIVKSGAFSCKKRTRDIEADDMVGMAHDASDKEPRRQEFTTVVTYQPLSVFGISSYLRGEKTHVDSVYCDSSQGVTLGILAKELLKVISMDDRRLLIAAAHAEAEFMYSRVMVIRQIGEAHQREMAERRKYAHSKPTGREPRHIGVYFPEGRLQAIAKPFLDAVDGREKRRGQSDFKTDTGGGTSGGPPEPPDHSRRHLKPLWAMEVAVERTDPGQELLLCRGAADAPGLDWRKQLGDLHIHVGSAGEPPEDKLSASHGSGPLDEADFLRVKKLEKAGLLHKRTGNRRDGTHSPGRSASPSASAGGAFSDCSGHLYASEALSKSQLRATESERLPHEPYSAFHDAHAERRRSSLITPPNVAAALVPDLRGVDFTKMASVITPGGKPIAVTRLDSHEAAVLLMERQAPSDASLGPGDDDDGGESSREGGGADDGGEPALQNRAESGSPLPLSAEQAEQAVTLEQTSCEQSLEQVAALDEAGLDPAAAAVAEAYVRGAPVPPAPREPSSPSSPRFPGAARLRRGPGLTATDVPWSRGASLEGIDDGIFAPSLRSALLEKAGASVDLVSPASVDGAAGKTMASVYETAGKATGTGDGHMSLVDPASIYRLKPLGPRLARY